MMEVTHVCYESQYPGSVHDAKRVSESCNISEERLIDLADRGMAPHWRIDGGKPMFKISEIKQWLAKENMITRCNGSGIPVDLRVQPMVPVTDKSDAPPELANISDLRRIPRDDFAPCVYFLCKDGEVVYVGQSVAVAGRVASHRNSTKDFDDVYVVHVPRDSLDEVESALIRHLDPRLNGRQGNRKYGNNTAPSTPVGDAGNDSEILRSVGLSA